jgi:hypothetical protein
MKKILSIFTVLGLSVASLWGQHLSHYPVKISDATHIGLPNKPGISIAVQKTFYSVKLSDFAKNPSYYDDSPTILRGVKVNFNKTNANCPVFTGLVAVDIDAGTKQKYCFYMSKELFDNWKNKKQTKANIAFRGNTAGGYIIREIE